MKFIDLFAGLGGFRIAMEQAGHTCVGFCENDAYAVASYTSMFLVTEEQHAYLSTLSKRQRRLEILNEKYKNGEWFKPDIKDVRGKDMPRADCWCFGCPCTSFSIAGKREGLSGQSGIIKEVFRLLQETRSLYKPEWLIYENVRGMLSSGPLKGLDFLKILSELDELGYDCEWQCFNTADLLPQWRERVYLIGHLRSKGERKILPIRITNEKNKNELNKKTNLRIFNEDRNHTVHTIKYQYQKNNSVNFNSSGDRGASAVAVDVHQPKVGDSIYLTMQDKPIYARWNEQRNCYTAIRRLSPLECWRLQGISDEYFELAEFVNSDSRLYYQAGNAVTVPIAYEIIKRM